MVRVFMSNHNHFASLVGVAEGYQVSTITIEAEDMDAIAMEWLRARGIFAGRM